MSQGKPTDFDSLYALFWGERYNPTETGRLVSEVHVFESWQSFLRQESGSETIADTHLEADPSIALSNDIRAWIDSKNQPLSDPLKNPVDGAAPPRNATHIQQTFWDWTHTHQAPERSDEDPFNRQNSQKPEDFKRRSRRSKTQSQNLEQASTQSNKAGYFASELADEEREQNDAQKHSQIDSKKYVRGAKKPKVERTEAELDTYLMQYALWHCSAREQRSDKLTQKLIDKGLDKFLNTRAQIEQSAARVMARCIENKYVDDRRYARSYILSRMSQKTMQHIARKLIYDGMNEELITSLCLELNENEGALSPSAQIERIFEQKFKGQAPKDEKAKNKQLRFFISRGFSFDLVQKLWRAAKDKESGLDLDD